MKNFMLILSAAILIITACSKSKTDPKPALTPQNATKADITGRWVTNQDTLYTTVNNKTTTSINNLSGTNFLFNADGTGTLGTTAEPLEGTFTYTVDDGIIAITATLTGGSQPQYLNFTIIAISSNKLMVIDYAPSQKDDIYFIKE